MKFHGEVLVEHHGDALHAADEFLEVSVVGTGESDVCERPPLIDSDLVVQMQIVLIDEQSENAVLTLDLDEVPLVVDEVELLGRGFVPRLIRAVLERQLALFQFHVELTGRPVEEKTVVPIGLELKGQNLVGTDNGRVERVLDISLAVERQLMALSRLVALTSLVIGLIAQAARLPVLDQTQATATLQPRTVMIGYQ